MVIDDITTILTNYPEGLSCKDIAALLFRPQEEVRQFLSHNKKHFHPTSNGNPKTVWKLGPEPEQLINLPPNSIFQYASTFSTPSD